jgi:hypothetical protein
MSVPSSQYLPEAAYWPRAHHPGQTVALATLIEYAVYGGSAAEFEAGWQTYLAAQYGIALDALQ